MTEKFQVKILRLKTGQDIICFCFEDFSTNSYHIKLTKQIHAVYDEETLEDEYFLTDWMDSNIFAYPSIKLSKDQVLFSSYATVYFGSIYLEQLLEEPDLEEELAEGIRKTLENIAGDLQETLNPGNKTLH